MALPNWFPKLLTDPNQFNGGNIPFGADASDQFGGLLASQDTQPVADPQLADGQTTLLGYPISQLQPQNYAPNFMPVRGLLTDNPGVDLAPSPYPYVPPILNSSLTASPYSDQDATQPQPVLGLLDTPAGNGGLQATNKVMPIYKPDAGIGNVSDQSLGVIAQAANAAGLPLEKIIISSTQRTPEEQADIMYRGMESGDIAQYGPAGRAVIAVYHRAKQQGLSPAEVKQNMVDEMNDQILCNDFTSRHLQDPAQTNVIDIPYKSWPYGEAKRSAFEKALKDAAACGDISKLLDPNTRPYDPSFHIEIPQRQSIKWQP